MVSVDVYRPAARKQLSVLARDLKLPDLRRHAGRNQAGRTGPLRPQGSGADRARHAAGGHRRPSAHRRRLDDGAVGTQGTAESDGDPVRRRRDDRAGRREIGRRIPQAPGHHRHHPDQDGRRCARRRGAFDSRGHRAAAQVRRRGRKVGRARTVPSGSRGAAHSRHGRHAQPDRKGRRIHRSEAGRGDAAQAASTTISRWPIFAIR